MSFRSPIASELRTRSNSKPGQSHPSLSETEFRVLVINASQEMAKEITLQLTINMPGCSIMYAPTIELARWILSRRKIDLVVSSPLLPDGSIIRLKSVLEKSGAPPQVVIVGNLNEAAAEAFEHSGYEIATVKRLSGAFGGSNNQRFSPPTFLSRSKSSAASVTSLEASEKLRTLGADLRNDLNNPLQAIVAMVFVAKAGGSSSAAAQEALDAIENAAKNMSTVVRGLEDKIRRAAESE